MAWDERRDSFGVSFELSGKRAAASGLRDDFILWREPCAGADDGCELAAGAGGLDMEDGALRDGLYAFPLAVQHDSSDHQQGIRQREMGISWDTPADSNRGSSLQSPTINTVGDDAHIVPAKCISETRKSSANSVLSLGGQSRPPLRTFRKAFHVCVRGDAHIAPLGSFEFALDFCKNG